MGCEEFDKKVKRQLLKIKAQLDDIIQKTTPCHNRSWLKEK